METEIDVEARADVVTGLRSPERSIPAKYFYDERGSRLFEQICETPEYYLTRVETALLRACAGELAACIGPRARVIEPGSGASMKTRILLDALENPASYVPVDISGDFLDVVVLRLRRDYPALTIAPVVADFTAEFDLPDDSSALRDVVFFPGSSIGNFGPAEIRRFLDRVRGIIGTNGTFVVGIDLVKDPDIINAAYNDAGGVTARFNLNMLRHLNEIAGADFRLEDFEHEAFFNAAKSRVEMHLVATRDTVVRVDEATFAIPAGESIRTEVSHKFTIADFVGTAAASGLTLSRSWTDENQWFSILLLESD